MLGAGALGRPRGMVWGERREEGSGWGTRVYMRQFHVDIRQNQYNIVKLKSKIKKKKASCNIVCVLVKILQRNRTGYICICTPNTHI